MYHKKKSKCSEQIEFEERVREVLKWQINAASISYRLQIGKAYRTDEKQIEALEKVIDDHLNFINSTPFALKKFRENPIDTIVEYFVEEWYDAGDAKIYLNQNSFSKAMEQEAAEMLKAYRAICLVEFYEEHLQTIIPNEPSHINEKTSYLEFLSTISNIKSIERHRILVDYDDKIIGTLEQLNVAANESKWIDLKRYVFKLNEESNTEISDIEVMNYLKGLTNNFEKEFTEKALFELEVFENMVFNETIIEAVQNKCIEVGLEIPTYNKVNSRTNKIETFPDFKAMQNKLFPFVGTQLQFAKTYLTNAIQKIENETQFSVLEWATIFYYAEETKLTSNAKTVLNRILDFMSKHKIHTSSKNFKVEYYEAKRRINVMNNYPINKLELIMPFLSKNYKQTVTKVENDIIFLNENNPEY